MNSSVVLCLLFIVAYFALFSYLVCGLSKSSRSRSSDHFDIENSDSPVQTLRISGSPVQSLRIPGSPVQSLPTLVLLDSSESLTSTDCSEAFQESLEASQSTDCSEAFPETDCPEDSQSRDCSSLSSPSILYGEPMTSTRSLPLNEVEFEDWFEEKVRNSPNMTGMDPRLYRLCAKAQYDHLKYWENKKPSLSYLLAMGKRG